MTSDLVISYDNEKRVARLSFTGEGRAWSAIRRVCQDRSQQTELIGGAGLTLPWWAFLGCRNDLNYLAHRHSFGIRADESAQDKLVEADRTAHQYRSAID